MTKRSKESSSSCRKKGWQGAPVTPAAFQPHGPCEAPQAEAWVEPWTPHQPATGPETMHTMLPYCRALLALQSALRASVPTSWHDPSSSEDPPRL